MNRKIRFSTGGATLTLTDKHYKATGGEATIFVNGNFAYKIFHDPKKSLPPPQKFKELAEIDNPQIVTPQEMIYDAVSNECIGYSTRYVADAFPMARFFTRMFKDENTVDNAMIMELMKRQQIIVSDVHAAQCLVVDLNELNVLVKIGAELQPWFIDTNSYATPSFPAVAVMDSIRDRRVSHLNGDQLYYKADILSDWFSWGILAFWAYTNIHPYRGNHPDYKPKDKTKQMDDGISVFHPGVRVPASVNNFNVIPRRHLDWFKAVFLKNERSVPPLPDSSAPLAVPPSFVTVTGTDKISVKQTAAFSDSVLNVFDFNGTLYALTKKGICFGHQEVPYPTKAKKVILCATPEGTVIVASQVGTTVAFTQLGLTHKVGTVAGMAMFARNGAVYTVAADKMIENTFTRVGTLIIHRVNHLENISSLTATIFDGCIIQDLLGKKYLTLPYHVGRSFSKYLPQLDKFRVIDAKSDKTVTVILAEQGGIYSRFIVIFDRDYHDFEVREVKDVAYDTINFTAPGDMCLLLASPTELEIFRDNRGCTTINNPPFDATMRLFHTDDGIFFINGNTIHQINSK